MGVVGKCNVQKNSNFKNNTSIINIFEHVGWPATNTTLFKHTFVEETRLTAPSPPDLNQRLLLREIILFRLSVISVLAWDTGIRFSEATVLLHSTQIPTQQPHMLSATTPRPLKMSRACRSPSCHNSRSDVLFYSHSDHTVVDSDNLRRLQALWAG